jgi:hypothetical protein
MVFLLSTTFGRSLMAWIISTGSLTLAGPFGTFNGMTLPERVGFWTLATGLSIAIGVSTAVWVDRRMSAGPRIMRDLAVASVLTVCFTPLLYLLVFQFTGGVDVQMSVLEMALVVFTVPFVVGMFRAAIQIGHGQSATGPMANTQATPDGMPEPRLFARIDAARRGALVSISGRDHYVDVVTEAGQTEILIRFSDALRELDGVQGLQVHRSHWVAADAVAGTQRAGGKVCVVLRDGRQVPVSRPYRQAVLSRWPEGASVSDVCAAASQGAVAAGAAYRAPAA